MFSYCSEKNKVACFDLILAALVNVHNQIHKSFALVQTLTFSKTENFVMFKCGHFGHELLHGLLRGQRVRLCLAFCRLVGRGAALAAMVGRVCGRGLPVRW